MADEPIPLRGKDGVVRAYALVDAEDRERVETAGSWFLHSAGYAYRHEGPARARRAVLMHRFVLGLGVSSPGANEQVDHVNRDRLDNRRENLRVVSRSENQHNRVEDPDRGVSLHRQSGRWRASVTVGGTRRTVMCGSRAEARVAVRRLRAEVAR